MGKIIKIFLLIVFLSVSFFAYTVIHDRYYTDETKIEEQEIEKPVANEIDEEIIEIENKDSENDDIDENTEEDEDDLTEEELNEEDDDSEDEQPEEFLEISHEDCSNHCNEYNEKKDMEYCQKVCGLSQQPTAHNGCDEFTNLEKDYCLKEKAIEARKYSICDEIFDINIKKSCINRITEDILNGM